MTSTEVRLNPVPSAQALWDSAQLSEAIPYEDSWLNQAVGEERYDITSSAEEQVFLRDAWNSMLNSWFINKPQTESDRIDSAVHGWVKEGFIPTPEENDDPRMMWGTGYDMTRQMSMLLYNWLVNPSKAPFISRDQLRTDSKAFFDEFIYMGTLFPNPLKKRKENDQGIIYSDIYRKRWIDAISREERNGAVWDVANRVEQFLLTAAVGSVAVIVSPPGWSGLYDRESGKPFRYPDTHVDVFRINDFGHIEACTLRFNALSLDQCEAILEQLGVSFPPSHKHLPSQERIEQIVRNYSVHHRKNGKRTFSDVIEMCRAITGPVAYRDEFGEVHGYKEIDDRISRLNTLTELDAFEDEQFRQFEQQYWKILKTHGGLTHASLREIARRNGEFLLNVWRAIHGDKEPSSQRDVQLPPHHAQFFHEDQKVIDYHYYAALKRVQQIAGNCGGGLNKSAAIEAMYVRWDSFTPRMLIPDEDGYWSFGKCRTPGCLSSIVGPCNICSHCEKTKPWEKKEYNSQERTLLNE